MRDQPYTVDLTRPARRAIAETLPLDVAIGVTDFLAGPLSTDPHRVGKELDAPMKGVYSARVMREYRLLYVIDEARGAVVVRAVLHRRDAYRAR